MPMLKNRPPKYSLHRPSGQAVVFVAGRAVYLGEHDSPASREAYGAIVRRWLSGEAPAPVAQTAAPAPPPPATVNDIAAGFWTHAEEYYRRRDGTPTDELANIRQALRPLSELFGNTPASTFGPLALQSLRDAMIRAGLARVTINHRVGRVKRCFRWAVSKELVPAPVFQALATVAGLRAGRSAAKETSPVRPVEWNTVAATLPHLPKVAAALVTFLWWTGCRPTEGCTLRMRDVDRTGRIWRYRPGQHKNEWRGRARTIMIGPRGQAAIAPFVTLDPDAFVFDAAAAMRERTDREKAARKTPLWPAHLRAKARRKAQAKRDGYANRPYSANSLQLAIVRACRKAGVEPFAPNRLRHSCATRLRSEVGLEAAALILGHSGGSEVTLAYAERDEKKAAQIAEALG